MHKLRFWLNDRLIEESGLSPTTTLLNFVRERGLTGTKEGCAEGDCGACTVALLDTSGPSPRYRAVNSCLVLLPMVQSKRVYTVEALAQPDGTLHPAQEAMVERLGSQCGYCTPGVVMSLFEATYRDDLEEPWQVDDQMCGNLCRCTGYRPIRDAANQVAGKRPADGFSAKLNQLAAESMALAYEAGRQRFYTPATLEELWQRLSAHPEAKLVCGGTDLSLAVTKRFEQPETLVSLEGIAALRACTRDASGWRLGATVTLTDLHDLVRGDNPALDKMLRFFASRQIKNRASLGGNLCNASPIGDMAPVLLALGATATLAGRNGSREVPLDQFFLGYRKTALLPGEILASVFVPHPPANARFSSFKVSKRRELDISSVAAGCYVELDPSGRVSLARFGFGGVAATPARARKLEAALTGKPWTLETVDAAAKTLDEEFTPISDHRASAWFRGTVARNLVRGFWLETEQARTPKLSDRPTATVHLGGQR